jgi:hypothetical protein
VGSYPCGFAKTAERQITPGLYDASAYTGNKPAIRGAVFDQPVVRVSFASRTHQGRTYIP